MTYRMLVTVDDTIESVTAATTAARLAVDLHAQVRVLIVIEDGLVGAEREKSTSPGSFERRRQAAANLLEFVRRKICAEGVESSLVEVRQSTGDPLRRILDEARTWPTDMIVMAVSDQRGVRSNYVGSVTEQVIEFSRWPVLVVPGPSQHHAT